MEAGDGQMALNVLRTQWIDVVLTDINMPGMDGEEFLRRIASDDVLKSIPVFVVSTDATANRIGQMLALGARGYIVKPFAAEDLRRQLERSLGVDHA
jgi:two-component system chemotaxis response regulator CheY